MAAALLLDGQDPAVLAQAASRLASGDLVAFPTETVYGLGARADDDAAVAKIFATKGRPSDHPLIVHVADAIVAQQFTPVVPESAQRLMAAFWPGPLTVIVPRLPGVAAAAAGGQDSIGLRCPAHPVAQALLRAAGALGVLGLAAPSANRFGRISPTLAAHVQAEFQTGLMSDLWVLDGGVCAVGIESSIVDCRGARPVLLRPGQLSRAQLQQALGQSLLDRQADSPRASGNLASHYAPQAPLRLMTAAQITHALTLLADVSAGLPAEVPAQGVASAPLKLAVYSRFTPTRASGPPWLRRMPDAPDAVAHELFAVLRAFDEQGAQLIWVENPPHAPEWDGVRDRLQRAAVP
jgi:L-threonylcarbamoyladenylate synthase